METRFYPLSLASGCEIEGSMTKQDDYFDISPLISEKMAVFPGDEPFQRTVALDFKKGDHLVLSRVQTTLHIGAHVDAPIHYDPQGKGMESRSLNYYLGACQVISVKLARNKRIKPEDIAHVRILAKRVLFKTGSFPDHEHWNGDFNALSAELVNELARQGVILIGIDTPSVDPSTDKVLEAHHALFQNDMANLEGIVLEEVPDGVYTLIALPLRLKDAEASPVRAVLVKETSPLWKK